MHFGDILEYSEEALNGILVLENVLFVQGSLSLLLVQFMLKKMVFVSLTQIKLLLHVKGINWRYKKRCIICTIY